MYSAVYLYVYIPCTYLVYYVYALCTYTSIYKFSGLPAMAKVHPPTTVLASSCSIADAVSPGQLEKHVDFT